jgi:transposase
MIPMPSGVRVWIAAGQTDMRRDMQGLALQVQEQLKRDPLLCVGRDYVAEPSRRRCRRTGPRFSAT